MRLSFVAWRCGVLCVRSITNFLILGYGSRSRLRLYGAGVNAWRPIGIWELQQAASVRGGRQCMAPFRDYASDVNASGVIAWRPAPITSYFNFLLPALYFLLQLT